MKISKLSISNFRCIKEQTLNSKELSIFIGDNATGKTSIIEAVNFALSPYFLSGRILSIIAFLYSFELVPLYLTYPFTP